MIRIAKWKSFVECDDCGKDGHYSLLFDNIRGHTRVNLCLKCLQELYDETFNTLVEEDIADGEIL